MKSKQSGSDPRMKSQFASTMTFTRLSPRMQKILSPIAISVLKVKLSSRQSCMSLVLHLTIFSKTTMVFQAR